MINNFYTYAYCDPIKDNEPFYIGKGVGNRDIRLQRRNIFFMSVYNKILKTGLKPIVVRLVDNVSENIALQEEMNYISYWGRRDNGTGCLTNLTNGGESNSGRIVSKELLCKINTGKKLSEETKKKLRGRMPWNKGISMSKETKQKISEANKGQVAWNTGKTGEESHSYGNNHARGTIRSDEFKQNLSDIWMGVKRPKTAKQIEKHKKSLTGYKHKRIQCPHCGLIGGENNMKRYHFDKCKEL